MRSANYNSEMAQVTLDQEKKLVQENLDQIITIPSQEDEFVSPPNNRVKAGSSSGIRCVMEGLKWGVAIIVVAGVFYALYAVVDLISVRKQYIDANNTVYSNIFNNATLESNNVTINPNNETLHFSVDGASNASSTINMTMTCEDCEENKTEFNNCGAERIADDDCMNGEKNNANEYHASRLESGYQYSAMQIFRKVFLELLRWTAIIAGMVAIIYIFSLIWDLAFGSKRYPTVEGVHVGHF
ncbi:uncharacterized protein LOC126748832 [Anthonomus grandis grandis]|uniref:uncharacterized protein LOC126748832 n=1 Tax=Anthonomus grandis grandis TaxID=2921223 RepID=UPI0021669457|nr:uncharacterized protein LOC126748832 [Anthonomus grandis grandis]